MKTASLVLLAAALNCSGQIYTNTFATNPQLGGNDPGVNSPGLWYVDRFAPATFASTTFDGGTSLDVGVSSSDYHGGTFSDTQGRKYYLTGAGVGSFVSAQLYIPSTWANLAVAPGLWLTAYDNTGSPSGFPIIGFYSDGTGDSSGSYFRVWDDASGYVNLNTPVNWNSWNTFTINFTAAGFVYDINGAEVYTDAGAAGSVSIANVMFESKNYGSSYDAYWNNLVTPSPTNPVPEPGLGALLVLGGTLVLGLKKSPVFLKKS